MAAITLACSSLLSSGCTDPSVERGQRATDSIAKMSDGSFKGVPEYWSRSATCKKIAIVDTKNGETIGTLSFDPSKEIWIVSTPTTHRELMKALVTQLNKQQ